MTNGYNPVSRAIAKRIKETGINARRHIVSELLINGLKSPNQIVQVLSTEFGIEVSTNTIRTDIAILEEEWHEANVANIDSLKSILTAHHWHLFNEAMDAWHASKEDKLSVMTSTSIGKKNKLTTRTKQVGNVAYFDRAIGVLRRIAELNGALEGPKGMVITYNTLNILPDEALEEILKGTDPEVVVASYVEDQRDVVRQKVELLEEVNAVEIEPDADNGAGFTVEASTGEDTRPGGNTSAQYD